MKRILLCLLFVLILTVALAACTDTPSPSETDTDTETPAVTDTETPENGSEGETENEAETEPAPQLLIGDVNIDRFSVVVAADASATVMTAVDDLVDYVQKALGCTLPVITEDDHAEYKIVLGTTKLDTEAVTNARTEVDKDGYAMLMDGGNLYITGALDIGTSYGIYDFLQNYVGVRYYSHSFTHIRADGLHDVPSDLRTVFNPVFFYRYNYCLETFYNRNNQATRTKSGGTWGGGVGGPHNLSRRAGVGGDLDAQPCLSDESIYEAVLASVLADAEKGNDIINVCQNDSPVYCSCEACAAKDEAAGSHMGSLLMFINRLADAVKEAYPDRDIKILTLAYQYSEDVPNPEVIKPGDNVIIQMCLINACFAHAFSDPECEVNVKTYKNMVGWSEVCDMLYIWDYAVNDSDKNSVGPNLNVLWDNMQAFRDCHVVGQFQNSFGVDTAEFVELRSYLIGQLLWNPNITKEQFYTLWNEFMEDYYGSAAPYVQEYIDLMNTNSLTPGLTDWNGHTSIWCDKAVYYVPVVNNKRDDTVLQKCIELWSKALDCDLTAEQFAHVEKSYTHLTYWLASMLPKKADRNTYSQLYKKLSDKYTYDYDNDLPAVGSVEGVDPTVPSEGLEFRSNGDGTCYVSDVGTFTGGLLVIPSVSPDGDTVTAIAKYAFSRANNLVEVIIPETVTSVGVYAFRECANLTTVTIPSTLTDFGFAAFGHHNIYYYKSPALTTVNYGGTLAEWAALYGDSDSLDLNKVTIHCTDGDIAPVTEAE